MADTVVDLGNGSPESTSMNEFMFDQKFPGEVFSGDDLIPLNNLERYRNAGDTVFNDFISRHQRTPGYEAEFLIDPSIETEDIN
jgi:hypothetical protein